MKFVAKIVAVLALFASVNTLADSKFNDSEPLRSCGGTVQLRQADNGDLALRLIDLNTSRCDTLRFFDASSGRQIKGYSIQGTSYTLSQSMRDSLSSDCRVGFSISSSWNSWASDTFYIVLPWCSSVPTQKPSSPNSYQLSGKGNCKLMINGDYSNRNVDKLFCADISGDQVVSYEYSKNNNCKKMINGVYTNVNVSDFFCDARP